LRRDHPLHYVTDRDNPDHLRPLQDRQMANPLFGHYPYTVLDTVARTHRQHFPRSKGRIVMFYKDIMLGFEI
jgi:hypothetical protein